MQQYTAVCALFACSNIMNQPTQTLVQSRARASATATTAAVTLTIQGGRGECTRHDAHTQNTNHKVRLKDQKVCFM